MAERTCGVRKGRKERNERKGRKERSFLPFPSFLTFLSSKFREEFITKRRVASPGPAAGVIPLREKRVRERETVGFSFTLNLRLHLLQGRNDRIQVLGIEHDRGLASAAGLL